MFERGLLLLLGTLVICLPMSQIPIFGALFIFPFPDLVLVAVAMLLAGIIPLPFRAQIVLALVFWALASVAIEIVRLPQHLAARGGVLAPTSLVHRALDTANVRSVSMSGDVNTIVFAAGPPLFVVSDIHQVGVRESWGRPLFNQASYFELVDTVWQLGFRPDIGGEGFPRVEVSKVHRSGWVELNVTVVDSPGRSTAQFRRVFPLPPPEPGVEADAFTRLGLSILHDNILRSVLELNDEVRLHRELTEFLGKALGKPASQERPAGPLIPLRVANDVAMPIPRGEGLGPFMKSLASDQRTDTGAGAEGPCGHRLANREFGANGWRTYVQVEEGSGLEFPAVLGHLDPDHAPFQNYCAADGALVTFTRTWRPQPGLKLSTYARGGKLTAVRYFQVPFAIHRESVVLRESLIVDSKGILSFSLASPIVLKTSPEEVYEKTSYRHLEWTSAPTL
jgi:hypothetical protein